MEYPHFLPMTRIFAQRQARRTPAHLLTQFTAADSEKVAQIPALLGIWSSIRMIQTCMYYTYA